MKRSECAITLIALIITIIVMLILLGVTISLTTGPSGLIEQTRRVKQNMNYKMKEEMLQVSIASSIINNNNKPYLSVIQRDLLKDGLISNKADITVDDIGDATVKTDIGDVIIKDFGIINDLDYYTEENFRSILTELQKLKDILGYTVTYDYDRNVFVVEFVDGTIVAKVSLQYKKQENSSQVAASYLNEYEINVLDRMNETFLIDGESYCVDKAIIIATQNIFSTISINQQQSERIIEIINNVREIVQDEGKVIVKAPKQ